MLTLHQSNRLENLADALALVLARHPGAPLSDQPILVSSPGMGTWLQIRLAQRLGIAAGFSFPLPARWLWQQYRQLVDHVPEKSVWDKAPLSWVLWKKLDEIIAAPDCAPLQVYLNDADPLKRYRLCLRLADLYDQYQMHRPDWLQAWAQNRSPVAIPDDQKWQPALWRLLQQWLPDDQAQRSILMDVQHWQTLLRDLLRDGKANVLPPRLVLFATGNLSAALLQVLQVFAEHIDVHLFLLNPSPEYWADLCDQRAVLKEQLRAELLAPNAEPASELFSDGGNPLLASLGQQGQSQFQLLLGHWDEFVEADEELFELPDDNTLLGAVQADIFTLLDGTEAARPMPPANIALHSCHSAMREVQVLHDRLLDMFAQDPGLKPRDVIVMVADVAPYAPLVEAVFGQAGQAVIPWAVADRTLADEVPMVRAFLTLLKPSLNRFTANEVLDLLEVPALRKRFGIELDEMPLVREWIRAAGIRWGLDAEHRVQLGFSANNQNTWQAGLQRLLLAVATGDQSHHWQNVLSLSGVQNGQVALAGKLSALLDILRHHMRALSRPRNGQDWRSLLTEMLDDLFDGDDKDQLDLEKIRQTLTAFVHDQHLAQMHESTPIEIVHDVLSAEFSRAAGGQRFLSGAVNICTLMPMRTVPFKVVCLLGMNEADYPHREHPPGYDLTLNYPRVGDRSRRAEDRYLFLEALLAAREQLYISWCGRDIRSNEHLPPSVVVADLMDYLDRAFVVEENAGSEKITPSEYLLTEHSLQPFSAQNFSAAQPARQSWSPLWHRIAQVQSDDDESDEPDNVVPAVEQPTTLTIEELAAFLANPATVFLQQRLRVRLGGRDDQLEDDEPQTFSGLEKWQLRNESAAQTLHGDAGNQCDGESELPIAERWWLEGRVPPGPAGEQSMHDELGAAQQFAERIQQHWPAQVSTLTLSETFEDVAFSETVLHANLPDHSENGLLFWSASKLMEAKYAKKTAWQEQQIRAERIVLPWLRHLMLNSQDLPDAARKSRGWFDDLAIEFPALSVSQARNTLTQLLHYYHQGIQAPLPYLPNSAWALLNDWDLDTAFFAEVTKSPASARLFDTAPTENDLRGYAQTLWSMMREHAEVVPYE
jgi:exodeoxyribonuclease V gamma subunit